jgi:uncharacterized protein
MMKILCSVILSAAFFFLPVDSQAGSKPLATIAGSLKNESPSVSLYPVRLYQKYLSPALGGQCPMYPSCSRYCVEAVNRHGAVMGWIMTCDRLMRCGRDEVKTSPVVWTQDGKRCHDPVSENDFWRK